MADKLPSDRFMKSLLCHTFGVTEANEHNPSASQAFAAWQEQIAKGETMGVKQMYEDAYREALEREERGKVSLAWEGTPRCSCTPYAWSPELSRQTCPIHGNSGSEPQPIDWSDLNAPAPPSRYAKLEEYDFSEEEINGVDEREYMEEDWGCPRHGGTCDC